MLESGVPSRMNVGVCARSAVYPVRSTGPRMTFLCATSNHLPAGRWMLRVVPLEHGLHGTLVEAIARRAGISQAYVFGLFGTKVTLFGDVVVAAFERTTDGMVAAAGDTGRPIQTPTDTRPQWCGCTAATARTRRWTV